MINMSKNKADLINKIIIGIGGALEFAGCVCVGFNWHTHGTVDSTVVIGVTFFGMWILLSGLFIYAARHDMDIGFSIPVYIVNKED